MDDKGLESAAILLMSLGEEEASAVFKHLTPKEVQGLGETIAKMQSVPRERVTEVLTKFNDVAAAQNMLVPDNADYVKNVLRKALGDDTANLLLDRILQGNDVSSIESLKWMDPQAVGELLRNEHPQIVAAILVHLDFEQASAILKTFVERHRNEVLVRIATLDGIQPAALRDLNDVMSKILVGGDKGRKASLGGVKTAAEMINLMGTAVETSALDFIREADNDLAQKIQDNMFTFDDLDKLDDKGFQLLLKEVQSESLILALKGAKPEMREKVFKNMSSRAAETLREDLDSRGPVRVSEVEAEQKELLKIVRRLSDEGQIVLGGGGVMTSSKTGFKNVPPPAGGKASVYARFIPREELGGFASWTPGALTENGEPIADRRKTPRGPAAAAPAPAAAPDSAALVHAARQQGYQGGYRDGLVALEGFKQSFAMQTATQVAALVRSTGEQLDHLQQQMAQALAGAAIDLARQIVRSELAGRPELVASVATEALDTLLLSARHITLRVHPDDHALVAAGAADDLAARGARLISDLNVTRGGCVVESDLGVIDASIEARWHRAAAALGQNVAWDSASTGKAP